VIKRDLYTEYWYRRYDEARNLNWALIVSLLIYQVKDLLYPLSESHIQMNIVYCAVSVLTSAIQLYSYRRPELAWLACPVMFMLQVRNTIRLADFE